ncbi:MAG: response regulator transcription factor [Bacteriovoracaceae bacterium]|nr:response regulator transcription factor [Bacteriovoracaceae bacterium]
MNNSVTKNILIVEDEENLGLTLQEYLEDIGYASFWAQSVSEARNLFDKVNPDVVLMDIGLPDGSGIELAKEFRGIRKDFLLLFLSALNDPDTKVEALEIGAEDYITKPFALKELTLRLEKSLQFREGLRKETYEYGPLKISFQKFQVIDAQNNIIDLGQKECALLKLLHDNSEKVLSREDIIKYVWGEDKYPSNRTVDNYIVRLRKWCETDKLKHIEIQSIRGIGYKLVINN